MLKICKEINANYVRNMVWGGAKGTVEYLTNEEIEVVLSNLEDCYPDGMEEVTLNDIFWFECETIAEWLGFDSFEDIMDKEGGIDNEEK